MDTTSVGSIFISLIPTLLNLIGLSFITIFLIDRNSIKVESRKDSKQIQEENMDLKQDKILAAIGSLEKGQNEAVSRLEKSQAEGIRTLSAEIGRVEKGQTEIKDQLSDLQNQVTKVEGNQRSLVVELRTLNVIRETPVI
jgi:chromosome segregation ATPase